MLLSAVYVLVVAQSSSEIPEGLMNNPVYYDDLDFIQLARRRVHWQAPSCWESPKRGDEISIIQEENLRVLPTFSKILSTLTNFPFFHVLWDEKNHFFLSLDLINLYISTKINIWFPLILSLRFSFLSTVEHSRISVYVQLSTVYCVSVHLQKFGYSTVQG
jgi:hypothetical protein